MNLSSTSKLSNAGEETWQHKVGRKHQKSSRNPLRDLNGGFRCGIRSRSGSGSSTAVSGSEVSTSVSIEMPNGYSSPNLSHSTSTRNTLKRSEKSSLRAPKSVSTVSEAKPSCKPRLHSKKRPSKFLVSDFFVVQKPARCKRNLALMTHRSSVKKPLSMIAAISKDQSRKFPSVPGELDQHDRNLKLRRDDKDELPTPETKLSPGSGADSGMVTDRASVDERSNPGSCETRTPPAQVSVSPEIQCDSSIVPSTVKKPACYAAGYVVSGVSDKRKCKPRGTLTVFDDEKPAFIQPLAMSDSVDDGEKENVFTGSALSIVPSPVDASVHWLLSPCHERKEYEICGSEGSRELHTYPGRDENDAASGISTRGYFSDISSISSGRRVTRCEIELRGFTGFLDDDDALVSFSRSGTAKFETNLSDKLRETKFVYKQGDVNSPASIDSIGSRNIIQTPNSDSSSDGNVGFPCFRGNEHDVCFTDWNLNSMITNFQNASLRPKNDETMLNPTSSSFCFGTLPVPPDAVDLHQFRQGTNDGNPCQSSLTFDDFSQSQLQISWKDNLEDQLFEVEEFDCCRCLSDEEDRLGSLSNHQFITPIREQNMDTGMENMESLCEKPCLKGRDRQDSPRRVVAYSCAESISTEGGSLIRSEDSDWAACYKNQFFEE